MRVFIDAVNNGLLNEQILYRGDSSMIDKFDISKTEDRALFNRAIYLTDDPVIAADYTLKGGNGGNVIFAPGEDPDSGAARTPKDLVAEYLKHIIYEELKYRDRLTGLRDELLAKISNGEIERDAANVEFENGRKKLLQDTMKEAKALYKERAKTMTMVKTTLGDYRFVAKDREGYLTTFDVPDDYIARCIDAEAPLPDHVIAAIDKLWRDEKGKDAPKDLRHWDENDDEIGARTFDQYLHGYKTLGSRYAWQNQNVGGTGENPTLDVLMNGTHHGISWFNREGNMAKFIKAMNKSGYVGIAYQGGLRLGGHNRGGGGHLHRAYAFWDADAINHFRVGAEKVTDPEMPSGLESGIRLSRKLYVY
jgi:hypothetical protein